MALAAVKRRIAMRAGEVVLTGSAGLVATLPCAAADDAGLRLSIFGREAGPPIILDMSGPLWLMAAGLMIFATVTAFVHIAGRRAWSRRLRSQAALIGELQERLQQAETFMSGERQVVICWGDASGEAQIEGDVSLIAPEMPAKRILQFGSWLKTPEARQLEDAATKLRAAGTGFTMSLDTSGGRRVEIDGRPVAGKAVMRIRNVSGDRLERQKAEEKYGRLAGEMAALHAVLDAAPQPIWLRYPDGRLAWVNQAYAEAVDCRHPNEAIGRNVELLDRAQREKIETASAGAPFRGVVPVIVAGQRTMLDIVDARTPFGSGGLAADASEPERLRAQLDAETAAHVRILNDLPTAVAFFDRKKNLRLYNLAFQKLWNLGWEFLATGPADGEILDRLRADRKLPEQVDFRSWKQTLLDAYQNAEAAEHLWHLPDGRMLRVVATPTADGGVSYVYHDMTERMTLEAQFKALSRVQSETLDSLKEGVAVFGSDGRLRLANAAFAAMWRLPAEGLQDNPHIGTVMKSSRAARDSAAWGVIRDLVIGVAERRDGLQRRETRADGRVIDLAAAPLPDGDTLLTFVDVTDEVNAERFLKEKNEALEAADKLKNAFINTVSYELRNPLQSVTMSAGILADETILGPLTPKQRQYALDAKRSADALLVMMTEIFDLASLDAGTLELSIEKVAPDAEIQAAAGLLADRLESAEVRLVQDVGPGAGFFMGDRQRVRQVMFHLIANAVRVSEPGQTVTVSMRTAAPYMEIEVRDDGPGIEPENVPRIFERFERVGERAGDRGVGLGLPLVKALVELHGGAVAVASRAGAGTTVTCRFPLGVAPAPEDQDRGQDRERETA
jgi:signal transduction histidine kinase